MKKDHIKVTLQIAKFIFGVILTGSTMTGYAQLNPFASIYHQNPYIYNPSFAGKDNVLNINTNYRRQWAELPGAPVTQSFTVDKQMTDRVGLGINVNDDQAGLLRQTRIMGTYAYHLPISKNQHIHFGLSLGVDNSRLNTKNAQGDLSDAEIAAFNVLKPYVDGDFGIAYTDSKLTISSALPNLKSAFFKTSESRFDADRMLFIALASYKFQLNPDRDDIMLEPVTAFRIVRSYDNIVDVGFNLFMNQYGVYMQSIYHSSQSLGLGIGLDQENFGLNFSYNVETGSLSTYTPGAFELGLKIKLFGKSN